MKQINQKTKNFNCPNCGRKLGTEKLGAVRIIPSDPVGLDIEIFYGTIICPECNTKITINDYRR